MYSIVNYQLKLTLTLLDKCRCTQNLIDLMYVRSPYRISNDIMDKLGKTPLDLLDKMPSEFVKDLAGYTHLLFVRPTLVRLSDFFNKNIVGKEVYSITNENFPRKKVGSFDQFLEFILECHPDNLAEGLQKYPTGYQNISCLSDLAKHLGLDSSYHQNMTEEFIEPYQSELYQRIHEYYA